MIHPLELSGLVPSGLPLGHRVGLMRLLMIHKACMPVYMNSGKIVADGRVDGKIEGSTLGPRGPKKKGEMFVFYNMSESKVRG